MDTSELSDIEMLHDYFVFCGFCFILFTSSILFAFIVCFMVGVSGVEGPAAPCAPGPASSCPPQAPR